MSTTPNTSVVLNSCLLNKSCHFNPETLSPSFRTKLGPFSHELCDFFFKREPSVKIVQGIILHLPLIFLTHSSNHNGYFVLLTLSVGFQMVLAEFSVRMRIRHEPSK